MRRRNTSSWRSAPGTRRRSKRSTGASHSGTCSCSSQGQTLPRLQAHPPTLPPARCSVLSAPPRCPCGRPRDECRLTARGGRKLLPRSPPPPVLSSLPLPSVVSQPSPLSLPSEMRLQPHAPPLPHSPQPLARPSSHPWPLRTCGRPARVPPVALLTCPGRSSHPCAASPRSTRGR